MSADLVDVDATISNPDTYEFWPDPTKAEDTEDKWLVTATILTRAAHDALGRIHDRTPVIIPKDLQDLQDLQDQWLDPTMTERDRVQHFSDTTPEPKLSPRIVGKEVGSVCNNGPSSFSLSTSLRCQPAQLWSSVSASSSSALEAAVMAATTAAEPPSFTHSTTQS